MLPRAAPHALAVTATIFAMTHGSNVRADDAPSVAQRCIYVDRLDQTRIVDERSILFFMRDHTVFQNVFPKPCAGLRKTDRIAYDVVSGRLCADELVTQLIDVGGYARGALCTIGMFVPIGDDEVQRLLPPKKRKRDHAPGIPAIESKPAELPTPAAAEPAAAAPASPANDSAEPSRDREPQAP
jgi:hypothetical protein